MAKSKAAAAKKRSAVSGAPARKAIPRRKSPSQEGSAKNAEAPAPRTAAAKKQAMKATVSKASPPEESTARAGKTAAEATSSRTKATARKPAEKQAGSTKRPAAKPAPSAGIEVQPRTRTGTQKASPAKPRTTSAKAPARKKVSGTTAPTRGQTKSKAVKASPRMIIPRSRPAAALMKPQQPDAILAAVVGGEPMSRTQVIEKVWSYIKTKGLQDTQNKRMINADELLKRVFGDQKQVSMFEMAKLVNQHLTEV